MVNYKEMNKNKVKSLVDNKKRNRLRNIQGTGNIGRYEFAISTQIETRDIKICWRKFLSYFLIVVKGS